MRRTLASIIALSAIVYFSGCSKDYSNGSATQNNSANPLNLLDSAGFNWSGTDPFSATINGVNFVGDSTLTNFTFNAGFNNLYSAHGTTAFLLSLKDVYSGNLYNIGYHQYNTYIQYSDSIGSPTKQYFSYLGNVGEVLVLQNDNTRFRGLFYFQGVNNAGEIVNITNGYFNFKKL